MTSLILLASCLIIATKWLDCYSTVVKVRHASMERNRWARPLMQRYGVGKVVWGVFALVLLVVGIYTYIMVMDVLPRWYQYGYIILALVVSVFQAAVAYTNWTGRLNPITWLLLQLNHYKK